ncbi:unnamed protein product [Sphenostylis stenocarpa]|uniref:Uncharacterized protein n=1 Tax=Sphenostylis stenocarpa TaxID=92480 RepID=A0AA86RR30_9FABA|nr:unnamed protein product [Sphenostylis stenocarpa]
MIERETSSRNPSRLLLIRKGRERNVRETYRDERKEREKKWEHFSSRKQHHSFRSLESDHYAAASARIPLPHPIRPF